MQVIAGSASIDLAKEIAQLKNWELIIPEYKIFADGENYIRIEDHIEEEVLIVQSLYRPQEYHLFQLLNIIRTIKKMGVDMVHVFSPYLCYARSDRVVLEGEAVSAETVLFLLESVGTNHLITLDVHNPKIIDYTGMKISNIFPIIAMLKYFDSLGIDISGYQILAPDEGAIERASKFGEALGIPYTNLKKFRDPITGEVGMGIGDAKIIGNKIILIDDIMATGTSLIKAVSLLKLYDIDIIHIFVSHALGTNAVDRLREIGNGEVIATSSVPNPIGILSPAYDLIALFEVP